MRLLDNENIKKKVYQLKKGKFVQVDTRCYYCGEKYTKNHLDMCNMINTKIEKQEQIKNANTKNSP